jgi:hypothetical protein
MRQAHASEFLMLKTLLPGIGNVIEPWKAAVRLLGSA